MQDRSIHGVLFDLDGTLVDTAPDMGGALNTLLAEEGRPRLPDAVIRPVVSHGSAGLLRLAYGDALEDTERKRLVARFLDIYEARVCRRSHLFDGADLVIDRLAADGRRWGIVTNKPGWLARPLIRALGLTHRTGCLVSGDCLPRRKPHPDPLFHGAGELGIEPGRCVYVGDAERDIEAGRAAGMTTVVASYGYIDDTEDATAWGADGEIGHMAELPDWIDERERTHNESVD